MLLIFKMGTYNLFCVIFSFWCLMKTTLWLSASYGGVYLCLATYFHVTHRRLRIFVTSD